MRMGMLLRSGWRNELAHDVPPTYAFERMLDEAAAALDEGVTGLWVYDHLEGVPVRPYGSPTLASTGDPSRLAQAVSRPAPSRGSGLPIWLGGSSERVQALAATKAEGINLGSPPVQLGGVIERFRERCAAAGREPAALPVSAEVQVLVDPAPALLDACVRQSSAPVAQFAAANIVGSPDEAADKASLYARAGVDQLIVAPRRRAPDEVRRTVALLSEAGDDDA